MVSGKVSDSEMTSFLAAEGDVQPTSTATFPDLEKDMILRADPIDDKNVVEAWEDLVRDLNQFGRRAHKLVSTERSYDPAFHRYRMMMEISPLYMFGGAVMGRLRKQTQNDSRTFEERGLHIKFG